MHKTPFWEPGVVLILLAANGLAQGDVGTRRNARRNRRCALTVTGRGVAVPDLPVVVRGRRLKELAGDEPVSVASLRVVGPKGEVSCQFDEFDGTGTISRTPNHTLDDDDELVFQMDLPAKGKVTYWLYWNTTPLPCGRYASRTLMGDAMVPAAWQHDIQLWNDQCLVGMRGPARGADPSKNQIENWGAGVLVQLRVYRLPVLNIGGSWSSVFPRGAFGSQPSAAAAGWERPRALVRGPVRVAAHTWQRNAAVPLSPRRGAPKGTPTPTVKADVEHRVWLYERGAYVCFDEIITPRGPAKMLPLRYEAGLGFGRRVGDEIWYSAKGEPQSFAPTQQQIDQAGQGKIVFQRAGFDPWMAGYDPERKTGYAFIVDTGEAGDADDCGASAYARTSTTLRYRRTVKSAGAGKAIHQRFWVVGLRAPTDRTVPLATWAALRTPPIAFGQVGKRGAR